MNAKRIGEGKGGGSGCGVVVSVGGRRGGDVLERVTAIGGVPSSLWTPLPSDPPLLLFQCWRLTAAMDIRSSQKISSAPLAQADLRLQRFSSAFGALFGEALGGGVGGSHTPPPPMSPAPLFGNVGKACFIYPTLIAYSYCQLLTAIV